MPMIIGNSEEGPLEYVVDESYKVIVHDLLGKKNGFEPTDITSPQIKSVFVLLLEYL